MPIIDHSLIDNGRYASLTKESFEFINSENHKEK